MRDLITAIPSRATRALVGVAIVLLLVPALALAATTQQLVTLATGTYSMTCGPSGGDQVCDRAPLPRITPFAIHAVITPASGAEKNLITQASIGSGPPATGLDSRTRAWMADMHALACGDPKGVAAYVDLVGNLTKPGFGPPRTIGNCQFNGGFASVGATAPLFRWTIGSSVIPPPSPPPTPVVTPGPTPTPTPTPTPELVPPAP